MESVVNIPGARTHTESGTLHLENWVFMHFFEEKKGKRTVRSLWCGMQNHRKSAVPDWSAVCEKESVSMKEDILHLGYLTEENEQLFALWMKGALFGLGYGCSRVTAGKLKKLEEINFTPSTELPHRGAPSEAIAPSRRAGAGNGRRGGQTRACTRVCMCSVGFRVLTLPVA